MPPSACEHSTASPTTSSDRLEDPRRPGPWDRRGMVVGQVQSGKTANYTGLICKAADAGYRLIVVLAGMHNSLRSQTQRRLDEGFLARLANIGSHSRTRIVQIGVGSWRARAPARRHTLTSSDADGRLHEGVATRMVGPDRLRPRAARRQEAQDDPREPDRVGHADQRATPTRAPADGRRLDSRCSSSTTRPTTPASTRRRSTIETMRTAWSQRDDPTAINRLIRRLLTLRADAYVAYTATPFANIFIYEERSPHVRRGSVPRSLHPPYASRRSNYVGPAQVFGVPAAEDPMAWRRPAARLRESRTTRLAEDRTQEGRSVPARFRRALREALSRLHPRRAPRGAHAGSATSTTACSSTSPASSRCRHRLGADRATRSTDFEPRSTYGGAERDSALAGLRELWESRLRPDFEHDARATFAASPCHLGGRRAAISRPRRRGSRRATSTAAPRTRSTTPTIPTGLSVIAVGGDKLCRGLTLEGLSVSYYLRASKMYDTLMQMGRWFGYRPGYNDLCPPLHDRRAPASGTETSLSRTRS